jgi:hypothetical protein
MRRRGRTPQPKRKPKFIESLTDALDALQRFRVKRCFSCRPGDGHELTSINN